MGNSQNQPQRIVGENRPKVEIARFTSTTTWTCPENVTNVDVWVCGGGGSGGAGATYSNTDGTRSGSGGNGGNGGECNLYRGITVTPNQQYSVVIGSGGSSVQPNGSNNVVNGNTGGESYFINQSYNALGGAGGRNRNADTVQWNASGCGNGGVGAQQYTLSSQEFNPDSTGTPGGFDSLHYYICRDYRNLKGIDIDHYFYIYASVDIGDDSKEPKFGLNPYDNINYGIGGEGGSTLITGSSWMTNDNRYITSRSGKLYGGKANDSFGSQSDMDNIDGAITCGGGGSMGGNTNNKPRRSGAGGSGLIIIYG